MHSWLSAFCSLDISLYRLMRQADRTELRIIYVKSISNVLNTVNREDFDVKIFSDSMACAKIKRTKYMRNINDNAVLGRLSENYLTQKIIA